MALVSQGWRLTVSLVDRGGNTTTRSYDFIATDTAGDISALTSQITAFLPDLAAVTLLKVKGYTLAKVFVEDALTLPTDAGAEVEAHALITAPIDGIPNKSATVDIPGPVPGIFEGTSGPPYNIVDMGDVDLINYLGNFEVSGTGGLFYISDGENLTQVNARGRRTHSHSLRG